MPVLWRIPPHEQADGTDAVGSVVRVKTRVRGAPVRRPAFLWRQTTDAGYPIDSIASLCMVMSPNNETMSHGVITHTYS